MIGPRRPWGAYTDFVSPCRLGRTLAALRHRDCTGIGQYIDLSQNEAGIHHLALLIGEHAATGETLRRRGQRRSPALQWGVPRCGRERYLVVSALSDAHFAAAASVCDVLAPFAALIGRERAECRADIDATFAAWMVDREVFETRALLKAGCPAYVSLRATD